MYEYVNRYSINPSQYGQVGNFIRKKTTAPLGYLNCNIYPWSSMPWPLRSLTSEILNFQQTDCFSIGKQSGKKHESAAMKTSALFTEIIGWSLNLRKTIYLFYLFCMCIKNYSLAFGSFSGLCNNNKTEVQIHRKNPFVM